METKLNICSLISGGKDSIYSIVLALKNGHTVTCLANLYSQSKTESDSYMYQTVGSEAVEFVAEALDLPLYRKEITKKPVDLTLNYEEEAVRELDEVEDLYELLLEIKAKHPEINAVTSGAIASTYQKNRVEHICKRLGWESVAYLWGRDQKEIYQEMIDAGMHSILIKTACLGLDERHLGKEIKDLKEYMFDLEEKYGVFVCGEGGEFESLTIDCPAYKKRIQVYAFLLVTP